MPHKSRRICQRQSYGTRQQLCQHDDRLNEKGGLLRCKKMSFKTRKSMFHAAICRLSHDDGYL